MFGEGQALRQEAYSRGLQTTWPMGARVDYQRELDTVRAQFDDRTFAAAWAEGRAMTREQAIAYALEATGPQ